MLKNTSGQKWRVFAFTRSTNEPLTGDAANITAKISIDYGSRTALADTNPTEAEDGYYYFDLSQAETNGHVIDIFPESSTSGVQVVGVPGSVVTEVVSSSGVIPTVIRNFDPITKAITLVRNDAYLDALGTAIEIPVNIPTGVDANTLDGARLGAKYKHGSTTLVGSVELVEIGSQWTARIEFAMAATAGKTLGEYAYDVEITFDGQDITILSGSLRLVEDYSTH
jgi:hypothetical protein